MKTNYLTNINTPADLRKIEESNLPALCKEIRSFLVDTITPIGGHLGSGLGVVELTVALHYVFNTPDDKIVFDVGHQAYPHKILTGRKELLHTIRQYGGISGFPKRSESEYDAFGTGHASTSVSAALGISVARDLIGQDFRTIAVIGDGSMTGGLAYEALNNVGVLNKKLLVVLNDNNISIDQNISAMTNYFNEIYSSQTVQNWKGNIWDKFGKLGGKGDRIRKFMSRIEGGVKSIITPGMFFEAMGFDYFGPINGHNITKLLKILNNVKDSNNPTLLHIVTEKGKGYKLAENDSHKFHAVGQIDKITGEALKGKSNVPKYQDVFGAAILQMLENDDKIVAISAAMLDGTGLLEAHAKYPNRVFDVGIAEGHAVTFAAGLATQGILPVVAIYSSFLQRAFDNIIHDVALQNLHVVFALDRAGLVGEDGATHHGVFDLAYLRMIPNMVVMAPQNGVELRMMLHSAIYDKAYQNKCVAIRYPRGNVPDIEVSIYSSESPTHKNEQVPMISLGKAEIINNGNDVAILAIGRMVSIATEVRTLLKEAGIDSMVVNMRFVKPLDEALLSDIAMKKMKVVVMEDGQKIGGLYDAVLEVLNQFKIDILPIGIDDKFVEHGDNDALFKCNGMDVKSVSKSIIDFLKN